MSEGQLNKYGYQESGEYLTPYEHTVIYDSDDIFQTAVALCTYRSQPCALGQIPQYISPKIVIFTSDEKKIKEYLDTGYQNVLCVGDVVESSRVLKVDHSNFHDLITLSPGMTNLYLMEIALNIQYDNYTSNVVSKQDAIDFKLALDNASSLHNFISWNGIQLCDEVIARGRSIRKYRESLALKSLSLGTFYKHNDTSLYIVYDREFKYEIMPIAKNHLRTASADAIVVYHHDYVKKTYVIAVIPRANDTNAQTVAESLHPMKWSGNEKIAHGEIPLGSNEPLPWA
jgi:hypothetical protein